MHLYGELARFWPLISPPSHYMAEARIWMDAIRKRLSKLNPTALDLGTGGGHSLAPLTGYLQATAIDLSEEMLSVARKLNPKVEHIQGDMRNIRLGRKFDVVLANDAIGYMASVNDLEMVLETARAHLNLGGLAMFGPDWFFETFEDDMFNSFQKQDNGVVLTMFEYSFDIDKSDNFYECLYNINVRENGKVSFWSENHKYGLFSYKQWNDLLVSHGFNPEYEDYLVHGNGRPNRLAIGTAK